MFWPRREGRWNHPDEIARIARDIRSCRTSGTPSAAWPNGDQRNPYKGTIYVRLTNIADRKSGRDQMQIMDQVAQGVLPPYAADKLRISVTPVSFISGGGDAGPPPSST